MSLRLWKPLAHALCAAPLLWLAWAFWRDRLGFNPVEAITHSTGDWALRFLLLSLAVTPLRRATGWVQLISFRRMLGLWAFAYAAVHLLIWAWLDRLFDAREMWTDITKRRFVTAGIAAFLCMLPLAFTSTRGWIQRLGRRWTQIHRLAYAAALAAVTHYWWLVKSDIRLPLLYALILAVLLGARLRFRYGPSRTAP